MALGVDYVCKSICVQVTEAENSKLGHLNALAKFKMSSQR